MALLDKTYILLLNGRIRDDSKGELTFICKNVIRDIDFWLCICLKGKLDLNSFLVRVQIVSSDIPTIMCSENINNKQDI